MSVEAIKALSSDIRSWISWTKDLLVTNAKNLATTGKPFYWSALRECTALADRINAAMVITEPLFRSAHLSLCKELRVPAVCDVIGYHPPYPSEDMRDSSAHGVARNFCQTVLAHAYAVTCVSDDAAQMSSNIETNAAAIVERMAWFVNADLVSLELACQVEETQAIGIVESTNKMQAGKTVASSDRSTIERDCELLAEYERDYGGSSVAYFAERKNMKAPAMRAALKRAKAVNVTAKTKRKSRRKR